MARLTNDRTTTATRGRGQQSLPLPTAWPINAVAAATDDDWAHYNRLAKFVLFVVTLVVVLVYLAVTASRDSVGVSSTNATSTDNDVTEA